MEPARPIPAANAEGAPKRRQQVSFAVEPTAAEIVDSLLLPRVPAPTAATSPRADPGDDMITPLIPRRPRGENGTRPPSWHYAYGYGYQRHPGPKRRARQPPGPLVGGEEEEEEEEDEEAEAKESLWRRFLSWCCIREPTIKAIKDHRRDVFRRLGIPLDASVEEASRKVGAPLGKIPDHAIRPFGGPTPEKVAKKEQARLQEEELRKAKERVGRPKRKVDPTKLAVAPWLADE